MIMCIARRSGCIGTTFSPTCAVSRPSPTSWSRSGYDDRYLSHVRQPEPGRDPHPRRDTTGEFAPYCRSARRARTPIPAESCGLYGMLVGADNGDCPASTALLRVSLFL